MKQILLISIGLLFSAYAFTADLDDITKDNLINYYVYSSEERGSSDEDEDIFTESYDADDDESDYSKSYSSSDSDSFKE